MPDEYLKDSLNKSHGIRSGEPKRPESLIEMPGMVPEVPEVSLCFAQEKNESHHPIRDSNVEYTGGISDSQRFHQNEMLHRNKNESYNTWKAKNAQTLHNITGSLERVRFDSKPHTSTKKSVGLVRKQDSGNGQYSSPIIAAKYEPPTNEPVELDSSSRQNVSSVEHRPRVNGQLDKAASNQMGNIHLVEHPEALQTFSFPQHQVLQPKVNFKKPSSPSSILGIQNSCKDRIFSNIPYSPQNIEKSNFNPGFCVTNYCKLQCPCVKCKETHVNSVNVNQFCEKPLLTDDTRANMQFTDSAKLYPSLDAGLINNHLSSLFHLINIQNEQISMLCQEMSSQKMILTALHEEVKKIHTCVSSDKQTDCKISPAKKKSKLCCSCKGENDQAVKNASEEKTNSQMKFVHTRNKLPPTFSNGIETRSVGVMTSSLNNSVHIEVNSEKNKTQRLKEKVTRAKEKSPKMRKHKKTEVFNLSPDTLRRNQKEEKRKAQDSAKRRKNKQGECNESSQSDDSFSLNEAAVVMKTETEGGDDSPEFSIHVNMPDYSSSSHESDTSDSSESEDEGQASGVDGSDGESSDPQIGWTFYDRVVGQVNNMLKTTSSNPRQEYKYTQRKNTGNVLYQCNEDYETENNWSKRVTFDGPPLEDSDNNGLQMPRYHHFRTNQDYRIPSGQQKVQDYLLCDYANGGNNLSLVNGSTNMSFATYRYYQRHQLLPPPPATEKVFVDSHRMKKKSKSTKNEKTPPMPQKSHKGRNRGHPSKILDVSALKHQPKLF